MAIARSLRLGRTRTPVLYHARICCPRELYTMSLPPIAIEDPADPRLEDYRQLKEKRLGVESGRFVAESERVVRRLVGSGLRVSSVLLTPPRLATLSDALDGPYPVYLAAQELLDGVAGFHVHRGC